jgi:ATP-dependent exoDNAse (exonuclease V) beta subunit
MKTQSPDEAIDDADLGGFVGRRTADTARQVGILAHSILEHVDFTGASAADLAALVERSALAIDGSIDAADRRVAIGRVTSFLASPLARELGEAKRLQREIAFRRRWPSRISNRTVELVGTIDCWFEDDRGWHIVDFKAVETLSPQSLEQYRLQLLTYALAIQPSLGKPPASLRIVELGPPVEIHEVPFDETSLDDAARRIDAAINAIHHR